MKKKGSVLTLLFFLGALAVPAQDIGVRLDALLGFQGFYKTGTWVPLTVIVSNDAARIRGDLEVIVPGSRSFRESDDLTFRQNLDVDPGQRRNIPFLVPILNPAKPIRLRITAGDTVIEQEINALAGNLPGRIVAVVGRGRPLRFLQNFSAGGIGTHLAYPHWEDLPAHWAGYDSIEALSLSAERLTNLSEGQLQAIESWVRLGGTLIIDGGASLTPRSLDTVGRFVEARYRGRATLEGLDSPYVDVAVPEGFPVLSQNGRNLAFRAPLDKGSVYLLTFDSELIPSIPGWEELFTSVLTDNSFSPNSPFPLKDSHLFDQLKELHRDILPTRIASLALFLPYLGLTYVVGYRWRRKNASLSIVIIAGLFSVLAIVYLSSMNGNPFFSRVDLQLTEVPSNSDMGLSRTFTAMGSARVERAVFSFEDGANPPLIMAQGAEPVTNGFTQTLDFEPFNWKYLTYARVTPVPYHLAREEGTYSFTAREDLALLAVASGSQVWSFGSMEKGNSRLLSGVRSDNLGTWMQSLDLSTAERLVVDNLVSYRDENTAVVVALPIHPREDLKGPDFIDEQHIAGAFSLLGEIDG